MFCVSDNKAELKDVAPTPTGSHIPVLKQLEDNTLGRWIIQKQVEKGAADGRESQ